MKNSVRILIVTFVVAVFVQVSSSFIQRGKNMSLLKVSKSGRYLVKENGAPFFWLGDTGWNLFIRLNREEAVKYLKDRSSKKFTVIQAHLLGWEISDVNAYGNRPFLNDDFNSPNEAYWKHVDFIIHTAEQQGLYMALLPAWASTYTEIKSTAEGKSAASFPLSSDTVRAFQYARYLGRRYRESKNIIWILGGDVWGRRDAIYDNLAKGLTETYAQGDPGQILISFHPQGGTHRPPATSTSEFYQHKPWMDFNMIQSGHRVGNKNYQRIANDYATVPVKPTLDSEPCYEQHPIVHDFKNGVFKAWHLRRRAYWSILAGGLGFTYGANGIWQMDKPGKIDKASHHNYFWFDALHYEGAGQMTYVRQLMESRPFISPERLPDQGFISSDTGGVDNRIQCARAADYSYVMVYSTNGTSFSADLSRLPAKKLQAWWYNPRDGKLYDAHHRKTSTPFRVLTEKKVTWFDPPGEPAAENDWLLVIEDASRFSTPPGVMRRT